MSDKKENEKAKKIGKKLKNEPSSENRDESVNEDLGKNPKLKKDLKELFDNFGQDTDSQINKSQLCSVETVGTIKQDTTTESYSEQCLENVVSTDDFSRANNKDSLETTLDGKFISTNDNCCNCHEIKCTCCQTDHNITDIDESQISVKINEEPPYSIYTFPPPNHAYVTNDSSSHEDPQVNKTNRYNYNQVHIRHPPKERTRNSKLFPRRRKIYRGYVSKNDSGETIPQLYKANVKHLTNYVPEKFTFRAVTGNPPGKLEYYHPSFDPYNYHYSPTRQRVNFVDDEVIQKNPRKLNKERKCIFMQLKKNKNKNSEKINGKYHSQINVQREKKNQYDLQDGGVFLDQACIPFDGNEYVSNKQLPDRIDIYCFDHLNTSYFRTCDQPPPLITDIAMEKTEEVATRFWAEIFGFIHVIIAFFIAFILQFYKFLLYSIVRPIMVGLVQLTSDYFFKPLLTITYNGFTQPFLVFLFNVAASFRDLCLPIAKGLGYFISEIAVLLRAIRLIDCGKNAQYCQTKDSFC